MIVFRSRLKVNGPMIVLIIACLSSLLLTTEGLLFNPKLSFLTPRRPQNQLTCRGQLATVPYPPSTRCKSKRDPSLDTVTDEDEEYNDEIEGNTEPNRSDNALNGFDAEMGNGNSPAPSSPESLSVPAVLFATVLFVSFWPLLALLRSTASPIDGFDIDTFMALKGIMADTDPTIVDLPSLSPAEQLVGAIFGPPQ